MVALARAICPEKDGTDSRGHQLRPCGQCIKTVRHITNYWFTALNIKADAIRQRAKKEKLDLPMVDLFEAHLIASSLLDPSASVELEGWGPA